MSVVPCLLHEDEHLLVVNKPAGINTHSPDVYASEGLYEWLRSRDQKWARLAIIHRLDKETSGVLVFAKTSLAAQSLIDQFSHRRVRKRYLFLTDRPIRQRQFRVKSFLSRAGERYRSTPQAQISGQSAETIFEVQGSEQHLSIVAAVPRTGRTHQIRVHAADQKIPILGDVLYGGTPSSRLFLHSASLTFEQPASGNEATFSAPFLFTADTRLALRAALVDSAQSGIYRLIHGAADRLPDWYVDRIGSFLLSQSENEPGAEKIRQLEAWAKELEIEGAYHKTLQRSITSKPGVDLSPKLLWGYPESDRFSVMENGLNFLLSFQEGYSSGLFHDQRENRRRLLTNYVAPEFQLFPKPGPGWLALNTFAYTCSFSVCAARLGLQTVSVDLSRKYLEWGKSNFILNQLDPREHQFCVGDVFYWLGRFRKQGRQFDFILLDPPTFSRSKETGVFRAEKDYGKLAAAALPLLRSNGVLFAATNAARLSPGDFLEQLLAAVKSGGREVVQQQYVPQPPDFPITRHEPGYLKSVWMRVR